MSLATSRSSGAKEGRQIRTAACVDAPDARSSTSSRDSPRATASCAISSSGRLKSNASTFTRVPTSSLRRPRDLRPPTSTIIPQCPIPRRATTESSRPPHPCRPRPAPRASPPRWCVDAPVGVTSLTLTVLTSIAVVVTLQYMQAVLVPVVIGVLVATGSSPFVTALARAAHPALDRRGHRAAGPGRRARRRPSTRCRARRCRSSGRSRRRRSGSASAPSAAAGTATAPSGRSRRRRRSSQKTAEVASKPDGEQAADRRPDQSRGRAAGVRRQRLPVRGRREPADGGRARRPSFSFSSTSSSSPAISTRRRSSRSPDRTSGRRS